MQSSDAPSPWRSTPLSGTLTGAGQFSALSTVDQAVASLLLPSPHRHCSLRRTKAARPRPRPISRRLPGSGTCCGGLLLSPTKPATVKAESYTWVPLVGGMYSMPHAAMYVPPVTDENGRLYTFAWFRLLPLENSDGLVTVTRNS